jgi:hypothetical protein
MNKTLGLEIFLNKLIPLDEITLAIEEILGNSETTNVVKRAVENKLSTDDVEETKSIIEEYIYDNAITVASIEAYGGYGPFTISIQNFGPLFWVEAPEFDRIKYFATLDDAFSCADEEYQSFL